MSADRLNRITARLESEGGEVGKPARLCRVAKEIIRVDGAGVMLMSGAVPQGSLCSSNNVSNLLEELQYTLGEGPCVDAYQQDRVVLEPDLANPVTPRWFAFTPRALEAGVGSVFGFPLRSGTARLGALNLYMDRPGSLSDDQHADATLMADVITDQVLNGQADAVQGMAAGDLELSSNFQFVVHNAAGMVSVQLGVSVTDALIRLRARAFSDNRLVREVAEDVVARRLSFL
ncbi:MAG TPA: GAF and ANTAR domain-containing protein [Acidimicrobiales bacterium]|nr:GAF and ANTAR domain-containing protein [Acidimicrobiales bacterium]